MHLFRRLAFLLIVWTATFSTSSPAHTPAEGPPDHARHLQVSIFNDAQVDADTLAEAQSRASAIFSHSGIEVDFLVCAAADPNDYSPSRTACSDLAYPSHLSIRIRLHALSLGSDVFGQAFVDASGRGLYSNVYFQNLSRGLRQPDLSQGEMLGCVIAHELGHLLLGTKSHSPSGLMQARWDASTLRIAARSSLLFTEAQSSILRSRLSWKEPASPCPSPQPFLISLYARQ
jgi:hypothetical protein